MPDGTLTIYNASAGSGKTYTLTGVYLASLFRDKSSYRKILAVTFTNKATAEMKSRILESLHRLSGGEECEFLDELRSVTGKTAEKIREEAGIILNSILHDYSRFSVSTIDSFFQKILRAFAREAGLHAGYNVEIDHDVILSAAVDEMVASAAENDQLKRWLTKYAISNIDEGKAWNPRESIMKLAEEIFREKFKMLSRDEMPKLADKDFLSGYIAKMHSICSSIEKHLKDRGSEALRIMDEVGVSDEMFFKKSFGVPKFLRSIAAGEMCEPGKTVREIFSDPPRWSTGKPDQRLVAALEAGLENLVRDAVTFYDANIVFYRTARVILSNIYALGILSDILQKVRELAASDNVFLLSDAGDFLNMIIGNDQSPFIYEKAGNRFENYMIDEFQDTSRIQWNNFEPLIDNSLAQGCDNLVVGDVKQSIYRWRNSDWSILGSMLDSHSERMVNKPLTVNWRSRLNIISFNNNLFTLLPRILEDKLAEDDIPADFSKIYSHAVQDNPGKKTGGLVRIELVENAEESGWKEKVLGKLPSVIESLQDNGYSASDIGIIVRDGNEGSLVLRTLIDHAAAMEPDNKRYNFNVVSSDSLLLANSPVINFLISALTLIDDPADMISMAALSRFYGLSGGQKQGLTEEDPGLLPEGWEHFLSGLKTQSLFEAVERIISFFGIGNYPFNVAYINAFQDSLLGFIGNGTPDVRSFLDWWEDSGSKKSLDVPGNQDAIRIQTIHKSKGLEFSAVILPFISWYLDHPPGKQPLLWVRPASSPFNELGIVPVKCTRELQETIFSDYYTDEKKSVFLDNLNLLYVALTRAKDVLLGFSGLNQPKNTAGSLLYEAFTSDVVFEKEPRISALFNKETHVFEYGEMPVRTKTAGVNGEIILQKEYAVNMSMGSLRLKLHGENYFSSESEAIRKKINYGMLMHEVFSGIDTAEDIHESIMNLVLEGKLPVEEADSLESKINQLINNPEVSRWFAPGNTVLKETGILLPSGNIRRPDRVITINGLTTVIDFKFGEENAGHLDQVRFYRSLLLEMGYKNVDAFIWYVDKNKIEVA